MRRVSPAPRDAGKPVVASMSSVAASGGYYIAMDANEIWASPATLTGSIGVFAVFPSVERTLG
jgi:protease-4